jgi:hypothetical protein
MSQLKVDTITDEEGTGAPDFPNGVSVNGESLAGVASQAEAETGTDNTKLMTPLRVAQAIDEQVPDLPRNTNILATAEITSSVTQVDIIDLGEFDELAIVFEQVSSPESFALRFRVSFDNGATFETSGYEAVAGDRNDNFNSSSEFPLMRVSGNISGIIRMNRANTRAIISGNTVSGGGRANTIAGIAPAGAVNALRVFVSAGNMTQGKIYVLGVLK